MYYIIQPPLQSNMDVKLEWFVSSTFVPVFAMEMTVLSLIVSEIVTCLYKGQKFTQPLQWSSGTKPIVDNKLKLTYYRKQ